MTPGGARRRTVEQVAAPYANFLLRVPRLAIDVCEVCHGPVDATYAKCFACNEALKALRHGTADVVSFVSLAPTGSQMATELYTYKRSTVPDHLRTPRLVGLAAVLWRWLATHEKCLAARVGATRFDIITTVPSTSGRSTEHPLERLVAGIVSQSADRHGALLRIQRTDLGPRAIAADRFIATSGLDAARVLIIDDTWTTGAHAKAASAALKAAGASAVGILAIGRWLNVDWRDTRDWLSRHRPPGWNWDRCCLEP